MIKALVHNSRTDKPHTMRDPDTGKVYAFAELRNIGPTVEGHLVLEDPTNGKQFRCAQWFYDIWKDGGH